MIRLLVSILLIIISAVIGYSLETCTSVPPVYFWFIGVITGMVCTLILIGGN